MRLRLFFIFFMVVIWLCSLITAANENNTLVFAISVDVDELDPGNTMIGQVVDNIFEGLVKFSTGSCAIEPCLATSWKISEDGKEIIFYLRKGVKFHDGTEFDADAVIFSLKRQYDPQHPYHQYGKWNMWSYMFSDLDRIEKIDDYTVKFLLKRPNVSIMTSLALHQVSIVSPANAEKYQEDAFKHPCGTGPFKFIEWIKDDHIVLSVNKDYWQGRPKLDRLFFKVIPDPSARLLALEVNEVQGMEHPDPVDFGRIKLHSNLELISEPGMNVAYMAMNTGYGYVDSNKNGIQDPGLEPLVKNPGYFEPLTKKKVRQAINMAIDKQSIVDNLYMGAAIKAKNGMPPFMLGYNDEIEDYPYDPDRAKELLVEAGHPDGFEVTLNITPVSRPYMFDPTKVAEAIQGYLAVVGIKVSILPQDWANHLKDGYEGKHQLYLLGWTGDNGDPDNFMNAAYGSNRVSIGVAGNKSFYINDEAQKLLSKALVTYDNNERAYYYHKVQEMIHEDAPWVYLVHATQNLVFQENIRGFIPHPTGRLYFYPVWIE
ncbi:MAG: ABC transporter substrate-binding protein [Candidatus Atribacteria bacterium]|nr:ABC transporter substrate-binding protein [Candidatus Atribacteria bacterium]